MANLEIIKAGSSDSGVTELVLARWSPRAFSENPVSSGDLRKLFTAASWAASSYNEQPWRFFVGFKGDDTHSKIFNTLIDFNKSWAGAAPVLFSTVAKTTITSDGSVNGHALHDTGAASAKLALQATSQNLYVHGMAGFDKAKIVESFGLPTDCIPVTVWALGYRGEPGSLPEFLQAMEKAPRERKALKELVFSAWEKPLPL